MTLTTHAITVLAQSIQFSLQTGHFKSYCKHFIQFDANLKKPKGLRVLLRRRRAQKHATKVRVCGTSPLAPPFAADGKLCVPAVWLGIGPPFAAEVCTGFNAFEIKMNIFQVKMNSFHNKLDFPKRL